MNIQEGKIYVLDTKYAQRHNMLLKNSVVAAVSNETDAGIFVGAQIGRYKTTKNNLNKIIVEINLNNKKSFQVISCDDASVIPKYAVKEEIGALDDVTLKAVKYQIMINNEGNEPHNIINDKTISEQILEILEYQKNTFMITNQEEINDIKNWIIKTNDKVSFVSDTIENENRIKNKKRKYVWKFISYVISFLTGVIASYCAQHWDNGITEIINSIYKIMDYIRFTQ